MTQPARPRGSEPHHRVYLGLWNNVAFLAQSRDCRNVWRYVLCGPDRITEGLFRLSLPTAEAMLDIPAADINEHLKTLHGLGVIEWDETRQHCLIVAALAFQGTTNPKTAQSVVNKLATLRNDFMMARLRFHAVKYREHRLVCALDDYFGRVGYDPDQIVETAPISEHAETNRTEDVTPRTSPAQTPSPSLGEYLCRPEQPFVGNERGLDDGDRIGVVA